MSFTVQIANESHVHYAEKICELMEISAKQRGTGIAKRDPEYIKNKMRDGKAIIAFEDQSLIVAGFCYIETWGHGKYVANSGLIVNHEFRQSGLATKIKEQAFALSRQKYPDAKVFGLTTSLPVMKINSDLGYKPVTFSELTDDEQFWKGCQSCVNYDILTRTSRKHCLCTGMLFDPAWEKSNVEVSTEMPKIKSINQERKEKEQSKRYSKLKVYNRWMKRKAVILFKMIGINVNESEVDKIGSGQSGK